ncbi:CHASE2 domain-containing protein [Albimonas sp. CAU 1670]|uniref:CHASE2 domain-containing protein n=1 Tax=Albimonas sp. CAU 1670 TaxID=3032599 RepID=UPI0023DBECE1|nr:CHASE2 domain-containing protein [Albimonas sp. CAU 1670]MDF2235300.1 CHASE2 domain-containing protein [Albimonas sp. CAU 1670]
MRLRPRWLAALVAAAAAAVVAPSLEPDLGLPLLYALRGERDPGEAALIVAVDQDSVDWLAFHAPALEPLRPDLRACLPEAARQALAHVRNVEDLPRSIHGCVLEALSERRPAAVAVDIHLAAEGDAAEDEVLVRGLDRLGVAILLEKLSAAAPGQLVRRLPARRFAAHARTGFFLAEWRTGDTYRYADALGDHPEARNLAARALELAAAPTAAAASVSPPAPGEVIYRNFNLYGPGGTIPTLRLSRLLSDPAATAPAANRAVFIGASQPGDGPVRDRFETPWSTLRQGDLSGVELVATAYLNGLDGSELRRPAPAAEMAITLALGLGFFALGGPWPGLPGAFAALGGALAWIAGATAAFSLWSIWLPVAGPAILAAPAAAALRLALGYREAAAMLTRLVPRPLQAALRGAVGDSGDPLRRETATVVVIDVVNSSGLAVQAGGEAYARLMRACLDAMTTAIEAERGFVAKYTGDGLIAVFAASVSGPDHARRAMAAAQALGERVDEAPRPPSLPPLPVRMRVGIDCGTVALVAVGSARQIAADVLGDPVIVATRLEQHGKRLDSGDITTILCSGSVASQLSGSSWPVHEIGSQIFAGHDEPVTVFICPSTRRGIESA